ncbi:hypothetical protein [uncultured Planococcus sp.]|uniref:hypothetical protein n=1 Tax=Planococcus donghaensis TaxID=414778 RepID=UPI0026229171|nr:hypothetical protein [uncultured Planococcus sp.]
MKKTIRLLFFCLLLSNGIQTGVSGDSRENEGEADLVFAPALLFEAVPAIQTIRIDTKLAGMSSDQRKRAVVKADFDEDAGQVDWKTAIIVLGVAFLVYWINRSKRHDID